MFKIVSKSTQNDLKMDESKDILEKILRGQIKGSLSNYSDYDKLVYFRWKALIRSVEYRRFCEEFNVEETIFQKEVIEKEMNEFTVDGAKRLKKNGKVATGSDEEEYSDLVDQREDLVRQEDEILEEAKTRFGILDSKIDDLRPWDKPIDYVSIVFEDYAVKSKRRGIIQQYEYQAVNNISSLQENTLAFLQSRIREGYKLVLIDPDMPIGFIMETLSKQLRPKKAEKAKQKHFESWEEAFAVWDICHKVDRKKHKAYLLETARLMRERHPEYKEWEVKDPHDLVTKQSLKNRVNDKLKCARKLINLAGKGKFYQLSKSK